MVETTALMLPKWVTLDQAAKKHQFEQLIRYFVSPLMHVAQIRPYHYRFRDDRFETYQAFVNGIDFVFIPGCVAFTTGLDQPEQRRLLQSLPTTKNLASKAIVSKETVLIPPMLVAKTPIPFTQQVKGVLEIKTGLFYGDPFFQKRRQSDIQQALRRLMPPSGQDPLTFELPKHWTTEVGAVDLLPTQDYYRFSVTRTDPDYETLLTALSRQGLTLADGYTYLYLRTWQQQTYFPWGNTYQAKDTLVEPASYFGLDYLRHGTAQELLLGQKAVGGTTFAPLNFSAYYQPQADLTRLTTTAYYRPIIDIVFSD